MISLLDERHVVSCDQVLRCCVIWGMTPLCSESPFNKLQCMSDLLLTADHGGMTSIYLSYLLLHVEPLTYFSKFRIFIIFQRRLFSKTRG